MAQINFYKTNPVNIQVPYEGYVSMFYSDQDTLSFLNSTGSLYPTLSGYIATSSVAFKAIDLTPGNKQLNGNFTATGSLTGQSLTIATSVFNKTVVTPSGSTIFGGFVDSNTHQFTGSFSSTGSSQFKGNMIVSGTITVSGTIAQLMRPAFRVTGSTSAVNTAGTVISGTAAYVDYNQGSHYNNTNGRFTVPITGLYHIFFNARPVTSSVTTNVAIRQNDSTPNLVFWESAEASSHVGVTAVCLLTSGSYVNAQVQQGNCSFDLNDSWGVTYMG